MKRTVIAGTMLLFLLGAVSTPWAQETDDAALQAEVEAMQEWAKDFSRDYEETLKTLQREVQERSEIVRKEVENILREHGEEIEHGREQLEHHISEIREWLELALQERNEDLEHFRRELEEQVDGFTGEHEAEEEEDDFEVFDESYCLAFSIEPVDAQFTITTAKPYYHIESESNGQSNTHQKESGSNEEFEGSFMISGTIIPGDKSTVLLTFEGRFHSEMTSISMEEGHGETVEQESHHGTIEGSAIVRLGKETVLYQQKDMVLSVLVTKGDA